jgi:small conductance mechanosensitive channel
MPTFVFFFVMEKVKLHFEQWLEQLLHWLLKHGIKIVFIGVASYIIYKILLKLIDKAVRITVVRDPQSSLDAEQKRENTLISIFSATLKIIILIIVGMMTLQEVGIMIAPLLAGAGIVGLALGFGGQYLIRDLISGLFIILENQYRIGDNVDFGSVSGLVEKITLRVTTVRDLDGTVHHVPHGEIKIVSNHSKNFSRVNLNIGVSYNADIDKVIVLINSIGEELAADPVWKDAIISAPKFLRVSDFGDSAVIIKILGDTVPQMHWEIAGELRKRILEAFKKNNIEIPFPQTVVHLEQQK